MSLGITFKRTHTHTHTHAHKKKAKVEKAEVTKLAEILLPETDVPAIWVNNRIRLTAIGEEFTQFPVRR